MQRPGDSTLRFDRKLGKFLARWRAAGSNRCGHAVEAGWRNLLGNERPRGAFGGQVAFAQEPVIGNLDGPAGYSEFARKRTQGGHPLPGFQLPLQNRGTNPCVDLLMQGRCIGWVLSR